MPAAANPKIKIPTKFGSRSHHSFPPEGADPCGATPKIRLQNRRQCVPNWASRSNGDWLKRPKEQSVALNNPTGSGPENPWLVILSTSISYRFKGIHPIGKHRAPKG